MPPAGFEPTIPASERPQTYALDLAATGIGRQNTYVTVKFEFLREVLMNTVLRDMTPCKPPFRRVFLHPYSGYFEITWWWNQQASSEP
jgi:hypothetical protein